MELIAEDEADWEYAKWGGPQAERFTIVWLVGGRHARLRSANTPDAARDLLAQYRAANPGGQYRVLHTLTTTTETWVE
jgi:hypothetical protein